MNDKIATRLLFRIGELVEQVIDIGMESTGGDARDYDGKNIPGQWYRLPVQDGICGDGSAYHIYINYGSCDSLCVFFSGGGMVWDAILSAYQNEFIDPMAFGSFLRSYIIMSAISKTSLRYWSPLSRTEYPMEMTTASLLMFSSTMRSCC